MTVALLGVMEDVDQLGLVDSVHHGDTTVELNNRDIKHVPLGGLLSRRIDIDLIELERDLSLHTGEGLLCGGAETAVSFCEKRQSKEGSGHCLITANWRE